MKQNEDNTVLKSVSALHEATKLLIQCFDILNQRRFLKSTDGEMPTYKHIRTERLSQNVTRKIIETYQIGLDGYLVLVSSDVQDTEGRE